MPESMSFIREDDLINKSITFPLLESLCQCV